MACNTLKGYYDIENLYSKGGIHVHVSLLQTECPICLSLYRMQEGLLQQQFKSRNRRTGLRC